MAHGVNDDLVFGDFIKDEIGIGRGWQTSDRRVIGARADQRMNRQKADESLNAGLDTLCSLWRMGGDVVENRLKIGKCRSSVANLHRPCFAHMVRTCSSVAKSPRAAASLDKAIVACSSAVKAIGGSASPANCNTSRAISSCVSGGSLRAASTARSSNFVMNKRYTFRDGDGSKNGATFCTGILHQRSSFEIIALSLGA